MFNIFASNIRRGLQMFRGFLLCTSLLFFFSPLSFAEDSLIYNAKTYTGGILDLFLSQDETEIFTLSKDDTLRIWNPKLSQTGIVFLNDENEVRFSYLNADYSPTKNRIAAGILDRNAKEGEQGIVYFYEMWDNFKQSSLLLHDKPISALTFSRNGDFLVTASLDRSVKRTNMEDLTTSEISLNNLFPINHLKITPNQKYLIAGEISRFIYIYNLETGKIEKTLFQGPDQLKEMRVGSSNKNLYTLDSKGLFKVWDIESGKEIRKIVMDRGALVNFEISPEDDLLMLSNLYSDKGMSILIFDPKANKILAEYPYPGNEEFKGVFSLQNQYFVYAGGSKNGIYFSRTRKTTTYAFVESELQLVFNLGFSSRGDKIFLGFQDGKEQLFSGGRKFDEVFSLLIDETQSKTIPAKEKIYYENVYSNKFRSVPVQNRSGDIHINTKSATADPILYVFEGKEVRQIIEKKNFGILHRSLALSPDGKTVVSGGINGNLESYSTETGKKLQDFNGHTGDIVALAISPNNRYLLSSGFDEQVILWDLQTGKLLMRLVLSERGGHLAYFSSGDYVAEGAVAEEIGWFNYRSKPKQTEIKPFSTGIGKITKQGISITPLYPSANNVSLQIRERLFCTESFLENRSDDASYKFEIILNPEKENYQKVSREQTKDSFSPRFSACFLPEEGKNRMIYRLQIDGKDFIMEDYELIYRPFKGKRAFLPNLYVLMLSGESSRSETRKIERWEEFVEDLQSPLFADIRLMKTSSSEKSLDQGIQWLRKNISQQDIGLIYYTKSSRSFAKQIESSVFANEETGENPLSSIPESTVYFFKDDSETSNDFSETSSEFESYEQIQEDDKELYFKPISSLTSFSPKQAYERLIQKLREY